jgi:hypothetical protein
METIKTTVIYITFFVGFFLLANAFDRLLRPELSRVQQDFVDQQENVTALFVGDSHTATAVNAGLLPDGWLNYAYPADTIFDTAAKFEHIQKKHALEILVIPFDFQMLTAFRKTPRNTCAYVRHLDAAAAKRAYSFNRAEYFWYRLHCALPLFRKENREKFMIAAIADIRRRITGQPPEERMQFTASGSWAFETPIVREGPDDVYAEATQGVMQRQIGSGAVMPELLRGYQQLIDAAHNKHIFVVGVRYPLDPLYVANLSEDDLQELTAAFDGLEVDTWIDATAWYSTQPEYFQNSDHLNASGAALFTPYLVQRIEEIR